MLLASYFCYYYYLPAPNLKKRSYHNMTVRSMADLRPYVRLIGFNYYYWWNASDNYLCSIRDVIA